MDGASGECSGEPAAGFYQKGKDPSRRRERELNRTEGWEQLLPFPALIPNFLLICTPQVGVSSSRRFPRDGIVSRGPPGFEALGGSLSLSAAKLGWSGPAARKEQGEGQGEAQRCEPGRRSIHSSKRFPDMEQSACLPVLPLLHPGFPNHSI